MGRPFACECAFHKCDKVRDEVEQPGTFFDQQLLFLQPLSGGCLQVWVGLLTKQDTFAVSLFHVVSTEIALLHCRSFGPAAMITKWRL